MTPPPQEREELRADPTRGCLQDDSNAWRSVGDGEPMGGWIPDERTVQECIEIVHAFANDPQPPPDQYGEAFDAGIRFACDDLTKMLLALLPKPDPVEAIVAEFHAYDDEQAVSEGNMATRFARWAFEKGKLQP